MTSCIHVREERTWTRQELVVHIPRGKCRGRGINVHMILIVGVGRTCERIWWSSRAGREQCGGGGWRGRWEHDPRRVRVPRPRCLRRSVSGVTRTSRAGLCSVATGIRRLIGDLHLKTGSRAAAGAQTVGARRWSEVCLGYGGHRYLSLWWNRARLRPLGCLGWRCSVSQRRGHVQ